MLIALYDGNDDDITVGGAAETVKFNRDGIPGGIRESAHSALDGAEIFPREVEEDNSNGSLATLKLQIDAPALVPAPAGKRPKT